MSLEQMKSPNGSNRQGLESANTHTNGSKPMTSLAQNQTSEQTAIAAPISFSILDNTIRVVDGLYSLNDLHKASGSEQKHRPKYWLENQQTQDLTIA